MERLPLNKRDEVILLQRQYNIIMVKLQEELIYNKFTDGEN
tara:strand:- start:540 stop:662 length:123 start_codon:yes stop_codon:yes gene_type:complete